ncbi:MAG: hypothetical protein K940chlam5_01608 [Candidatus Anoxychlamydiales bacterium]|nr:hypothetical protein [Candidatus Anoxychlamydiales bacterium]
MDVAVVAITVFKDKCLFLKRNFDPKNWSPPCGRLEKEEEPIDGLKREVLEETSLEVIPIITVDAKNVLYNKKPLLSISYVCFATSDKVKLSHEHSDYKWIAIDDLKNIDIDTDFNVDAWPLHIKTAYFYAQEKKISIS